MLKMLKKLFVKEKIKVEESKKFSPPEGYIPQVKFPSVVDELILQDFGEYEDVELLLTYPVKTVSIPSKPGCWDVTDVTIYKTDIKPVNIAEDRINTLRYKRMATKIGEYQRNYSSFYDTWYPFRQGDKHFALFSRDYQTVEVMSLPDCKIVATGPVGFCPTHFYVPFAEEQMTGHYHMPQTDGTIGFVAGCYWGDDSGGCKLHVLDLSKVQEGILNLSDEKIGYTELDTFDRLHEVVKANWNYYFETVKDPNSRFMRDPSLNSASFKIRQELKSIPRANLI